MIENSLDTSTTDLNTTPTNTTPPSQQTSATQESSKDNVTPSTHPQDGTSSQIQAGRKVLLEEWRSRIQNQPANSSLHFELGLCHLHSATYNLEEAIICFEKALALSMPLSYLKKTTLEFKTAFKLFELLAKKHPEKPLFQCVLAFYHLADGNETQAYNHFKTIMEQHKNYAPVCVHVGRSLLAGDEKNYTQTNIFQCFLSAKMRDPNYVPALKHEGDCYLHGIGTAQDIPAAVKCYEQAIKIDLYYAPAWINYGYCLLKGIGNLKKDPAAALKSFINARVLDTECAQAWLYIGYCYLHGEGIDKNLTEAHQCLSRALELNSQDAKTWKYLGHLYIKKNNLDEAIKCYKQVELLQPNNLDNLNLLNSLLFKKLHSSINRVREALTATQEAHAEKSQALGSMQTTHTSASLSQPTGFYIHYLTYPVRLSSDEEKTPKNNMREENPPRRSSKKISHH